LSFPVKLVNATQPHKQVDNHEVIVDRIDLSGVASPYEASACDGELLVRGDVLCGAGEVADVRDRDQPLEGRGPEENSEGACRVQQKGPRTRRPRQRHHHFLNC